MSRDRCLIRQKSQSVQWVSVKSAAIWLVLALLGWGGLVPLENTSLGRAKDQGIEARLWLKPGPPGAPRAAYGIIKNVGQNRIEIKSLESEQFSRVEIHKMVRVGKTMGMEPLKPVYLDPGEVLKLEPGGTHLMLMGPVQPLLKGSVKVSFVLDSGQRIMTEVALQVKND